MGGEKILLLQKYDFLLIVVTCVTLFSITPESLRIFLGEYPLSGTVVYEGVASGSRTELTLPAGHLYLVKCGRMVTKVAL